MTIPSSRGFTLVELIISLTIFAMVAVIVYATLSFCSRAVDSGEAHSTENQRRVPRFHDRNDLRIAGRIDEILRVNFVLRIAGERTVVVQSNDAGVVL